MRAEPLALFPDLAGPLGWTLVHSFWQGFFVWLVLRFGVSRIPRPDVRAKLGVLGLAIFIVMQATTMAACLRGASWLYANSTSLTLGPRGSYTPIAAPSEGWIGGTVRTVDPWMPWLVVGWTIWTAYRLLTCARGVRGTRRLLDAADPLPEPLLGRLRKLADRVGVGSNSIRFVAATLTAGPGTIGWLRPFIFVPPALLLTMSPLEVEAIVAHELAHVLRRDYLLAAIQFVIEGIYTCNPFVRWIIVQLNDDAEHACDRIALRHVSDPADYARALRRVAEEAIAADRMILAATGGSLVARVRWILQPPVTERSASAWTTVGVAGACVAVLLAISTSALASASAVRTEAKFLAAHTFAQAVDEINAYDGDVTAVRAAVARVLGGAMPADVAAAIEVLDAPAQSTLQSSPATFKSAYVTLDEVVARSHDRVATARIERFLMHALGADGRSFAMLRLRMLMSSPDTYARLGSSDVDRHRLFVAERYENDRYGRLIDAMQHLPEVLASPERLAKARSELTRLSAEQSTLATLARADNDAATVERFATTLRESGDPRFGEFLAATTRPTGPLGRSAVILPGTRIVNRGPERWVKVATQP